MSLPGRGPGDAGIPVVTVASCYGCPSFRLRNKVMPVPNRHLFQVIYIIRDPKDVCVSLYYYAKMASFLLYNEDFGEFIKMFLAGKSKQVEASSLSEKAVGCRLFFSSFIFHEKTHILLIFQWSHKPLPRLAQLCRPVGLKMYLKQNNTHFNAFVPYETAPKGKPGIERVSQIQVQAHLPLTPVK